MPTSPGQIAPTPRASGDLGDLSGIPCFANSRACGEFQASVGTPVSNAYVNIDVTQLGAWTRTWSPTGETGYMSAIGTATVRRGEGSTQTEYVRPLGASNTATEVGDGFATFNSCNTERNEVEGSSRNSAQGIGGLSWYNTFRDIKSCAGPNKSNQGCDANGELVDTGGDTANCDPDSGGSGSDDPTVGSGTQFQPGDYTNGETVDWGTGVGDGGSSVCGANAMVDYVSIDVWNGSDWEEWGSGYATTC